MESNALTWIDYGVMIIYLVGVTWWGLKNRSGETSEGYFLAGRSMTWPIIGIALFAANVSSSSLLSWAGDAHSTGISVFNYGWAAVFTLIIFLTFILPLYLNTGIHTMPEYLEKRFDYRSRYYLTTMNLFGYVFLQTASTLYAGALVLQMVLPGLEIWVIVWLLAIAAASYTIPGGLSSVLHTEVIQAVLLLVGSTIVTLYALDAAGGWANVVQQTPPEMLSLIRPMDDPSVPWHGLLLGIPLLGFYYWCTSQSIVQRTLSAKSINHGRKGALLAALLNFPILYVMVLPGVIGKVIYPDLPKSDMILPTMIFGLLPVGLKGLLVTSLLAAMASTISAVLNSASTLFTYDFMMKRYPNLSNKQLILTGKISALVMIIIASIWAPNIARFDSMVKYFQSFLSYVAPPVVAVFIAGVFWKKANANAAFSGLITGITLAILLLFFKDQTFLKDWHFLLVAPFVFTISASTIILVALNTAKDDKNVTDYMWDRSMFAKEQVAMIGIKWYQDYRILSVLLIIFTVFIVFWWR